MLYLVRHGQTEHNRSQRLQGRSDRPLNEEGRRQARELGAWFAGRNIRFDGVYSSPLGRAVETARLLVGEGVPIRTDERLIEMDYGPYEGMDLKNPAPEVLAFFRDFVNTPAPAGMEPLEAVTARLGAFLEEHRAEAMEQTLLISTHAIALKGALEYLTPESRGRYWAQYIGNCAIFAVAATEAGYGLPTELER